MQPSRRMVRLGKQAPRSPNRQGQEGTLGTHGRIGQCDAGHRAAHFLRQIVGTAVSVLALTGVATAVGILMLNFAEPAVAFAGSTSGASVPAPQRAPSSPTSGTPAPDPSPDAANSATTRSSSQSVSSGSNPVTSRRGSTVTAPATTGYDTGQATAPSPSSNVTTARSKQARRVNDSIANSPPRARRRASQQSRQPAESSAGRGLGPVELLLRRIAELFRPSGQAGAVAAETPSHNGLLLLLSAVALGVLVVASSSLRRLLGRIGTDVNREPKS